MYDIIRFLLLMLFGFFISIWVGHYATKAFHAALKDQMDKAKENDLMIGDWAWIKSFIGQFFKKIRPPKRDTPFKPEVPNFLTGIIERIFFTLLVASGTTGTGIAMIGWITVKMVHTKLVDSDSEEASPRRLKYVALLSSMVSLTFALLGGLIVARS